MRYKNEFKEIYYRLCRNHSTVEVNSEENIIKIKIGNNINIPPEINDELNTIDGYIKEKWLIFEDRTITSNDPINQIEEAFLHIIDQILYLELLFEDNENHNKKTIK